MDGTACPLLVHAREAAESLPDAVAAADGAQEAYDGAEADLNVSRAHLDDFRLDVKRQAEGRLTAVRAAEQNAVAARGIAERAAAEVTRHRTNAERARDLRVKLDQLTARVADITARIAGLDQDAAEAIRLQGIAAHLERELSAGRTHLSSLRGQVQMAREQAVRAETELAHIAAKRVEREQTLRAIADLVAEEARQERRRLAASYYLKAVDRTGIPSLLLEQLAPQLEARINDMLSPVGRAVRIDTTRELTSGKVKTEVSLSFRSPVSGDEYVPIAELSGGEEDMANLAFAAGLARVASDMSGVPLGMIFLDEPLVGVSESLQTEALEVMGRIGTHADRLVVITHRRDLASACDAVIEVSQNGSGSCVEVR
jgi:DNA repair exonuclease SbcCD ATPase subunit